MHAEAALKAIWFRHPTNAAVNELMEQGLAQMQNSATLPAALKSFRSATDLDPMFAESWNKVATVLFLQHKCAPVSLFATRASNSSQADNWPPCSPRADATIRPVVSPYLCCFTCSGSYKLVHLVGEMRRAASLC